MLAAQLHAVHFRYRGAADDALRGVTAEIVAGTVTGVVGHNGAGKSTLLLMLAGCKHPTAGTVRVLDRDPSDTSVMPRVGALTERFRFHPLFRVSEVFETFRRLYGQGTADVEAALTLMGLRPHWSKEVRQLSSGLYKRLAIAVASLHRPEMLLLDEPFAGLDPESVRTLLRAVVHWRDEGRTVVVFSHDLPELEEVVDQVIALRHGRLVAAGSLDELRDSVGLDRSLTVRHTGGTFQIPVSANAVAEAMRQLETDGVELLDMRVDGASLADIYERLHGGPS